MGSCSAPGCNHNHSNCRLFRFPTDIVRRKLWTKNCRRPFATPAHRICQHHFKKHLLRIKGSRWMLLPNAVPTIFKHTVPQKTSRKPLDQKMNKEFSIHPQNEKQITATSEFDVPLKIADCWSEQEKHAVQKELLNALYEDTNPLADDVRESNEQNSNKKLLGLENIPIIGNDISSESNIEFSYSTPKKLNDLTPILAKWSPKINNVVSVVEDLLDSSDDEDDKSDEETDSDHVIYIDEDLVKQEEFVDENSEENFDCESIKSSKKDKDEFNCSFDENKIKEEYHIIDTLRVKIPKIDINGTSIYNYRLHLTPENVTRNGIISKKKSCSSTQRKKLSKKSPPKKSSNNSKTHQNNQRSKETHSSVKSKRPVAPDPKPQSKILNNKRQSLRISGKSPEIKLPEYVPSVTRSGKKRIYDEPKGKSINSPPVYTIDDTEASHRTRKTSVKKEPEIEEIPRPYSPPPSAYRKNVEVLFVCQCCDRKYASVEQVKAHIRTHFPNCTTN